MVIKFWSISSSWNEKVHKYANSTLKAKLDKLETPVYEAHTLLDPSDVMKYSGTTAMIVHTQSTDELKFRLRMVAFFVYLYKANMLVVFL